MWLFDCIISVVRQHWLMMSATRCSGVSLIPRFRIFLKSRSVPQSRNNKLTIQENVREHEYRKFPFHGGHLLLKSHLSHEVLYKILCGFFCPQCALCSYGMRGGGLKISRLSFNLLFLLRKEYKISYMFRESQKIQLNTKIHLLNINSTCFCPTERHQVGKNRSLNTQFWMEIEISISCFLMYSLLHTTE
jgi:hypothetical protein